MALHILLTACLHTLEISEACSIAAQHLDSLIIIIVPIFPLCKGSAQRVRHILLLRYFHVGESHRGYLGTGSVDWSRMWGGLAAADFTGPITFESFSSAVVSPSLSNTLCVWRDL